MFIDLEIHSVYPEIPIMSMVALMHTYRRLTHFELNLRRTFGKRRHEEHSPVYKETQLLN